MKGSENMNPVLAAALIKLAAAGVAHAIKKNK